LWLLLYRLFNGSRVITWWILKIFIYLHLLTNTLVLNILFHNTRSWPLHYFLIYLILVIILILSFQWVFDLLLFLRNLLLHKLSDFSLPIHWSLIIS
jgi:hypothetical protein